MYVHYTLFRYMSRPPTESEIRAFNERLGRRQQNDIVRSSFITSPESPINLNLSPVSPEDTPAVFPRILANITKVVEFEDPIMMTTEEIHVEKYILEDPNNVVIVYGDNKYFFTNRENIYNQIDDATVYPCKTKGFNSLTIFENIDDHVENRPLYDLKKIGLIVPFCDIMVFFENREAQLFGLIEEINRHILHSLVKIILRDKVDMEPFIAKMDRNPILRVWLSPFLPLETILQYQYLDLDLEIEGDPDTELPLEIEM